VRVIVLDPGHGGQDPGAIGPSGLKEADVNWRLASILKRRLERAYRVYMTRNSPATGVSLSARCALANTVQADVFISLHCNSAANREAHGTETYHLEGSSAGQILATRIHRGLTALGLWDRGVRTAAYYVLRHTKMPAVLVELAFISNPREEQLLGDIQFLATVADKIALAIEEYLGNPGGEKSGRA
jgi:N-acetylmuramoyl-L-alanine amidase